MESSFKQLLRLERAARGKTGKYGEEYNLRDELPGLWGFRSVQSNPERSLVYKTTSFASDLKKADWEIDFYSRPILDENGKKRWELLIASTNDFKEEQDFNCLYTRSCWWLVCPNSSSL